MGDVTYQGILKHTDKAIVPHARNVNSSHQTAVDGQKCSITSYLVGWVIITEHCLMPSATFITDVNACIMILASRLPFFKFHLLQQNINMLSHMSIYNCKLSQPHGE